MLNGIARGALWLDTWLQDHLGRPYNALLGVGLIIEIVHRGGEIMERITDPPRVAGLGFTIAMELALLIHQVGALSHHLERRRKLTRGRKAGPDPAGE